MTPPDDLSKWSLHCFCLGALRTPHAVARQGNHGRLLFEIENWRDIDELDRAGLAVSERSIRELHEFGLLERNESKLRCGFPRFGPDVILPLRERMGPLASELLDAEAARIDDLAQQLDAQGMPHAVYAVIFGHVMDGLLWTHLRCRIEIPDTAPTPEFPLWRGVFWAVYPPRKDAIGTNEIVLGDAVMTLVWSEKTAAMLNALRHEAWPLDFMRFLLGEVEAPPSQAVSAGLVDASWSAAVPVFGAPRFARLAELAEDLAESAALRIVEKSGALSFLDDLHAPQRNVILIHEFIWALQSAFNTKSPQPRGRFSAPAPPADERGSVIVRIRRRS